MTFQVPLTSCSLESPTLLCSKKAFPAAKTAFLGTGDYLSPEEGRWVEGYSAKAANLADNLVIFYFIIESPLELLINFLMPSQSSATYLSFNAYIQCW